MIKYWFWVVITLSLLLSVGQVILIYLLNR